MKLRMILLVVAGLLAVASGCNGFGDPAEHIVVERQALRAVTVRKGPTIDGTLNSRLWQRCPPLVLGQCMSEEVGELKGTARVLFDQTHLYVAWDCTEPDSSRIKTAVTQRDGDVWNDDYVDLFIIGDSRMGSYHFVVNAAGTLLDAHTPSGAFEEDTSWNSSASVKASIEKDKRWIVTMSVPLKEIGACVGENQTWAMNLNRTRPLGQNRFVESSWSSKGRSQYKDPSGWGKIVGVRIRRRDDGVTRLAPAPK